LSLLSIAFFSSASFNILPLLVPVAFFCHLGMRAFVDVQCLFFFLCPSLILRFLFFFRAMTPGKVMSASPQQFNQSCSYLFFSPRSFPFVRNDLGTDFPPVQVSPFFFFLI